MWWAHSTVHGAETSRYPRAVMLPRCCRAAYLLKRGTARARTAAAAHGWHARGTRMQGDVRRCLPHVRPTKGGALGGPRQVRDARPDFRPPDFKQGGRACDWAASGTAAARALGQHPPTVIAPGLDPCRRVREPARVIMGLGDMHMAASASAFWRVG
jgi:hypothetical protein